MPRTLLTAQVPLGPYPGTVSADDLDFTWAAADLANGNDFAFTGRELILARNDDAAPQTITLTSVADSKKRMGTITAYSRAAGEYGMFWAGSLEGWVQSGNKFFIDVSDASIFLAIIKLPG